MNKVIWLLPLLFSACFHPSGEYYDSSVKPKDFSKVSINLDNAGDTLYIDQKTQLNYSAINSSLPIVKIKATLGGVEIYSTTSMTQGSFYVFPPGSGTYVLQVIIIVDSGSGSLLDKLGGEQVQVWRSFVVIIDLNPPPLLNVKLDTTGGTMTVRWNASPNHNFSYYTVTKTWNNGDGIVITSPTITISSKNQPSWNDSSYVGGNVQYLVLTVLNNGLSGGLSAGYVWFPKAGFKVQNNVTTLHWLKSPFYKNAKAQVFAAEGLLNTNLGVTDSTYQVSAPTKFGHIYNWSVQYSSKNPANNFLFTSYYYRGIQYLSNALPQAFNPKNNRYYGIVSGCCYVETDTLLHFTTEIPLPGASISPDGNHMITYQPTVGIIGTFYQVDPLTLAFSNGQPATAAAASMSVANNGLIEIQSYTFMRVCTWPDLQVVYSSNSTPASITSISPSGNYLFDNNNLYQYTGSTFQLIGPVNGGTLFQTTFTDTDNLILEYADGTIVILDSSLNVLNTIKTPVLAADVVSYDPVSKQILIGSSSSGYYIVSPATGIIRWVSSFKVNLVNGKLFCLGDTVNNVFELNYDLL
jgi:hypothetical protein